MSIYILLSCRKKLRYKEIKVLKSHNQSAVMSENEKLIMTNTPLEQGEFKGKTVFCGLRSSHRQLAEVLELMEYMTCQRNKLQKATDNLIRKGNYGIKREIGVNYQILGVSCVTWTKSKCVRHIDIQCPYRIGKNVVISFFSLSILHTSSKMFAGIWPSLEGEKKWGRGELRRM